MSKGEETARADAHGLTSYHTPYLELAIRRGVPTLDTKLASAAQAEGVTLL